MSWTRTARSSEPARQTGLPGSGTSPNTSPAPRTLGRLHWLPVKGFKGVSEASWGAGLEWSAETEMGEQREAVVGWSGGSLWREERARRRAGWGLQGAGSSGQPAGGPRCAPPPRTMRSLRPGEGLALVGGRCRGPAQGNPMCLLRILKSQLGIHAFQRIHPLMSSLVRRGLTPTRRQTLGGTEDQPRARKLRSLPPASSPAGTSPGPGRRSPSVPPR